MVEIIQKQTSPKEMTLTLVGELNFMVRKDFQAAIDNAQDKGIESIILNLSHVTFIDCSALGILIKAKQELAKAEITFTLITSPGRVADTLKSLDIGKIIPITLINQEI